MTLYTIGHSTRSAERFLELLCDAGIRCVWDVRTFPGSRRYPHFNAERLAESLPASGIEYQHHPELGGRRRPSPEGAPSAWRNEGFRGYAEYMTTGEFRDAVTHLMVTAEATRVAIMCSEAVPWRCHRNLVSDAVVARGAEVLHILDGRVSAHVLTKFALVQNNEVRYPPPSELVQRELDLNR